MESDNEDEHFISLDIARMDREEEVNRHVRRLPGCQVSISVESVNSMSPEDKLQWLRGIQETDTAFRTLMERNKQREEDERKSRKPRKKINELSPMSSSPSLSFHTPPSPYHSPRRPLQQWTPSPPNQNMNGYQLRIPSPLTSSEGEGTGTIEQASNFPYNLIKRIRKRLTWDLCNANTIKDDNNPFDQQQRQPQHHQVSNNEEGNKKTLIENNNDGEFDDGSAYTDFLQKVTEGQLRRRCLRRLKRKDYRECDDEDADFSNSD